MQMTKKEHLEVIYEAIEAAHLKMKELGYGNHGWEFKVGYVQGLIRSCENAGIIDKYEASDLRCMLAGRASGF